MMNSSGMEKPAPSTIIESSDATTMKMALMMLFAAMIRDRCLRSDLCCTSAYSGTL